MTTITTEDGVVLKSGDHAYDYYTMKPGVIGELTDPTNEHTNPKRDIWFDFHHDGGGRTILNGERICSDTFAKRQGFPNAN